MILKYSCLSFRMFYQIIIWMVFDNHLDMHNTFVHLTIEMIFLLLKGFIIMLLYCYYIVNFSIKKIHISTYKKLRFLQSTDNEPSYTVFQQHYYMLFTFILQVLIVTMKPQLKVLFTFPLKVVIIFTNKESKSFSKSNCSDEKIYNVKKTFLYLCWY